MVVEGRCCGARGMSRLLSGMLGGLLDGGANDILEPSSVEIGANQRPRSPSSHLRLWSFGSKLALDSSDKGLLAIDKAQSLILSTVSCRL